MARSKVTVVGAGNVGATCAHVLAQRDYTDVVLVDIKEELLKASTSTRWVPCSGSSRR